MARVYESDIPEVERGGRRVLAGGRTVLMQGELEALQSAGTVGDTEGTAWVVCCNDYPEAVCSSEDEAIAYCAARREQRAAKLRAEGKDPTIHAFVCGHFHWHDVPRLRVATSRRAENGAAQVDPGTES